jgi:hypothetical protein
MRPQDRELRGRKDMPCAMPQRASVLRFDRDVCATAVLPGHVSLWNYMRPKIGKLREQQKLRWMWRQ